MYLLLTSERGGSFGKTRVKVFRSKIICQDMATCTKHAKVESNIVYSLHVRRQTEASSYRNSRCWLFRGAIICLQLPSRNAKRL